MDRRDYLATLGTTVALAGCNSLSESDGANDSDGTPTEAIETAEDGPPYFERVTIEAPSSVAVGEDFTLTVKATNTGGRDGDFTTTLTTGSGGFTTDTSIRIPDVGRGEAESTTIGPFQFETVQDLTFRITDYAVRHELSVEPAIAAVGEEIAVSDGLSATLDIAEYRDSFYYTNEDFGGEQYTDFYYSFEETVLAIAEMTVRNDGDTQVAIRESDVEMGGETAAGFELPDVANPSFLPGTSVVGQTVAPGSSATGWLLLRPKHALLDSGARVTLDHGGSDDPDFIWEQSAAPEVPEFHVTSVDLPSEVEIGAEAEVSLTVENRGEAAGTFNGRLYRRNVDDDRWLTHSDLSLQLPAGESQTVTRIISEPYLGPSEYRFLPSEATQKIDFTPARQQYGERYVEPEGTAYTVRFLETGDTYTTNEYDSPTYEAEGTFAFVEVTAESTQPDDGGAYAGQFFHAVVDGNAYDPVDAFGVVDPVSGDKYTGAFDLSVGESVSGWLIYDVPAGSTREDISIQLRREFGATNISSYWESRG
jgi:hypothetical protein